ncbi:platelet-activating factor acetylhydrolase 2, cytoplasmic-like [Hyperolius riggenbachi]|uniref:platelet-activating factor acetylhydrolase 2, cytoplasmic-like n=1 Tax=Hyperolius riggenbachi TaxID=752182 RepID=UPI0035A3B0DA
MGNLISLNLPSTTGQHVVGCTDIMVGAGKEGSFFRLFYPCRPSPSQKQQPRWVPHAEYLAGFLAVRGLDSRAALYGASLIIGSPQVPVIWNGDLMPGKDRKPLIIFSHGLGSFRGAYSSLCSELASNGFLVAAVEHRDGSACATYHFSDVSAEGTSTALQEVWIPFRKPQPGTRLFYFRNYQVHQRAYECVRAASILQDIDTGRAVSNILPSDFSLDCLKDRIDFTRVAVMGHSFGGATALQSLMKGDLFRCAVVLDAWMPVLEESCYPCIQRPILSINSETFQDTKSVQKMMRLNSAGAELKYLTVRGCFHHTQTDSAFISGHLASKLIGPPGTMDAKTCLEISVVSSLQFLRKHLDLAENGLRLENLSEEIQAEIIPNFPVIFQLSFKNH